MKYLLSILLLGFSVGVMAQSGVRISALPSTNASPVGAFLIVDQPISGHATNDTFSITLSNLTASLPSTQLQTALGQIYQSTNATLTAASTNSFTGTGLILMQSAAFGGTPGTVINTTVANAPAKPDASKTNLVAMTGADLNSIGGITSATTNTGLAYLSATNQVTVATSTQISNAITGTVSQAVTDGAGIGAGATLTVGSPYTLSASTATPTFKTLTLTNPTVGTVPLIINHAASATADLFDGNVGGTSRITVNNIGAIQQPNPSGSFANGYFFAGEQTGLVGKSQTVALWANGFTQLRISPSNPVGISAGIGIGLPNGADSPDTYLLRGSAANVVQLGQTGASPGAQTLAIASATGTDHSATNFTIALPQGTGVGQGGGLVIQRSQAGTASASTANPESPAYILAAHAVAMTSGSAVKVGNFTLATNKTVGIHLFATTRANDGTNYQAAVDEVMFTAVNVNGTLGISTPTALTTSTYASSGAITTSWTVVANGNSIDLKNTETSTVITPTTNVTNWRADIDTDDSTMVIIRY